jgi:DNA-binding response OmpR family regulator
MKRVYIVEDNPDISELIEYLVNKIGLETYTCANVKDFKNLFADNKPDLIILDIMLPDGNGLELCEEIKNQTENAEIPIILMSALANVQSKFKKSRANDYISKPFDIQDFTRRVKSQIAS